MQLNFFLGAQAAPRFYVFLVLSFLLDSAIASIPGQTILRRRRSSSSTTSSRKARASQIEYRVVEGAKHGSLIGEPLSRVIGKTAPNVRFKFSRMNRYLGINETSGQMWVKSLIDREGLCDSGVRSCCPTPSDNEKCFIPVHVAVTIKKQPIQIANVFVHVEDINDEPPRFPAHTQHISLAENTPVGEVVAVSAAVDRDTYQNAVKSYKLTRCDENVFNLTYSRVPDSRKAHEVRLILNKKLDHETKAFYTCRILATDGRQDDAMDIKLTVKDVNDHAPEWSRSEFKVQLKENFPRFSKFYQLKATDKDEDFGEVTYSFGSHSSPTYGPFSLNTKTGAISLEEELNYDKNGQTIYKLPVVASDNGRPVPKSVTNTLVVTVLDVNDNQPIIKAFEGRIDIEENSPPKYLTHIEVTDDDQGINKKVSCSLDTYDHLFNLTKIFEGSYNFYLTAPIDREDAQIPANGFLKVVILCTDAGKSPRSSREDIIISIVDVNDHAPRFTKSRYIARLVEDEPGGTIFLNVHAKDRDHGENARLEYSLIADPEFTKYLTVDKHSGSIASADRFDREKRDRYEFEVMVKDNGSPKSLNDTAKVTLIITDINDNRPKFPLTDDHRFQIKESAPLGTILGVINATDPDLGENGTVVFNQERGQSNLPFLVHQNGQIELTKSLDRERKADYSLTVTAHDQGSNPKVTSTTIFITVVDVNDSPPRFDPKTPSLINISCDESDTDQFHETFISATDPDENSEVIYSLGKQQNLWHQFSINEKSGLLTVKSDRKKCRSASFNLLLIAKDKDNKHFTKSKRVRVVVRGHTKQRQGTFREGNYGTRGDNTRSRYPNDMMGGDIDRDELDLNLIIIIILVCTAIVLTLVMLAAAFYLRKRQLRSAQEYEKGRREKPDGDTLRRDKERHFGPPGSMYTASLPSSPRKEFEHLKKSNMSLEDVYHEHEMDTKMYTMAHAAGSPAHWFSRRAANLEASRLKLEGSSSKLKPAQYGNDIDESGVPLNQQISHESAHTYQSMSSHNKDSPENAGYTVFQHELFSYIPDTLRSANVDSKRKNKTSQVTISFV